MKVSYGTDVGLVRSDNQDSVFVKELSPNSGLFIVADGMGGYEGGEFASSQAVKIISDYILNNDFQSMNSSDVCTLLSDAVHMANTQIYKASLNKTELHGMGTTVVVCLITHNVLYTASVGDSRGYIYSKGKLCQITSDHSLVADLVKRGLITQEEARVHPQKNVITRAVGSEDDVIVDTFVNNLSSGDTLLICSDGLHTMLIEDEIKKIIKNSKKDTSGKLIAMANDHGGRDNISVITVKICDEEKL